MMDFPPSILFINLFESSMQPIVMTMVPIQTLKVSIGRRFCVIFLLMRLFVFGSAFLASTTTRPHVRRSFVSPSKSTIRSGSLKSGKEEDIGESNHGERTLGELLLPSEKCKVDQMSGTDLAYIGDAVFELFIRSRHVWPSKRTSELQDIVVGTVRAEHQSELLEKIKSDYPLSDKELQVLMRGRNSVTRSKNRRNPAAYQDSTSFEALVGYLYISDQQRCTDLLNWLDTIVDHD